MSSVLDALKRMEEEEKNAGKVLFAGTLPGRKTGLGRLLPFVVVFAAGVGLAAAGFWFAYGPKSPVVSEDVVPASTSVFRVVAPTPKPSGPNPLLRPAQHVAVSPAADQTPSPALGSPAESDTGQGAMPVPEPAPRVAPQAVASSQDTSELSIDELRGLPAADAGAYRLQGVRWSQTPSRRIAVINSQIMREGATVDGARVQSITKEGVVLDIAGVRMFLAFVGR
ncbi:general secretion pathway protein GspB [Desulfoluna spongiiphila]|uniref:general secretion pathway protein GspB n=1 Tax=Desulfoluna spongiiphila TaxID=419481 RepID=UPI0012570A7D|nr:general secretion pathway protein GspB [Desulfoluna spongiiphila]VVS94505.1 type ii secretion system protein b [Desulfoluna spongiiphila]